MSWFTESIVEDAAIGWFQELGYSYGSLRKIREEESFMHLLAMRCCDDGSVYCCYLLGCMLTVRVQG